MIVVNYLEQESMRFQFIKPNEEVVLRYNHS